MNTKKDEILPQYKDGIASLKRVEIHKNLWKENGVKEYLIDIYYNEKSMDQFKYSCQNQLKEFGKVIDTKAAPISVPSKIDIHSSGIR